MTSAPPVRDGYASIHGRRLFWKIFGEPGPAGTLLTLHGGPGATHDYLLPLADLAARGYRVVFYDQVGCGRSERTPSNAEYTVERDVADLEALRQELGLGPVHLLGSSYGGMLAIAYALEHPASLRTLIVASGLASVPLTVAEMHRLKRELPESIRSTLERHEAKGEFEDPEYLAAVQEFYRRHLCRLSPWPPEFQYSLDSMSLPKYGTMNGPNEFTITGTTRDWDQTPRLPEIRLPTLITVGRYDEVTPVVAESIHRGIRGSELVLFEQSSHVPFWEERARYMDVVARFIRAHA